MMDNKILLLSMGVMSMVFLASCTSLAGRNPDQNPPRLVSSEKQEQYGWDSKRQVYVKWDRPGAFGSVPENLRATGDQLCLLGGWSRAVGYHPQALGMDGQQIRGGGYLCSGYRMNKNTQ